MKIEKANYKRFFITMFLNKKYYKKRMMKKMFKLIILGVWEGYKEAVVIIVTTLVLLWLLIGGEFSYKLNIEEFFLLIDKLIR